MDLEVFGIILALLSGILFLWKSGDYAIASIIQITTLYRLTTLFSGFVLMSFSTGIPELAVTLNAILNNAAQVSLGDIIGSNVIDITLVIGIAVLSVGTIHIPKRDYSNIVIIHLIATISTILVFFFDNLTRWHGLGLILVYFGSLLWIWKTEIIFRGKIEKLQEKINNIAETRINSKIIFWIKTKTIIKFFLSMIVVVISSKVVVLSSIFLSKKFGLSLEVVGTTILAIGTSLPELSLSINATRKKEYSLVLSSCLGSVIEQGTFIIGVLALSSKNRVNITPLRTAVPFILAAFVVTGYCITKPKKISKVAAIILLIIFVLFVVSQIIFMK
jgi:cation:H+ antiporter